jgi:hypothetical protein
MKVSDATLAGMQDEAERVWSPELARLMDCRCFSEAARSSSIYNELRAPPSQYAQFIVNREYNELRAPPS